MVWSFEDLSLPWTTSDRVIGQAGYSRQASRLTAVHNFLPRAQDFQLVVPRLEGCLVANARGARIMELLLTDVPQVQCILRNGGGGALRRLRRTFALVRAVTRLLRA